MLLAQSGVRADEAGPTGPAVALATLLCIQNHLEQFTDPSGKRVSESGVHRSSSSPSTGQ
ncbi:MAG: hypothetical protein ACFB21_02165 [Opitutales bacterium]